MSGFSGGVVIFGLHLCKLYGNSVIIMTFRGKARLVISTVVESEQGTSMIEYHDHTYCTLSRTFAAKCPR